MTTINPAKCVFGVTQLQFLGHHIDSQGIHPLEKVQVVRDFPQPTTHRKLCESWVWSTSVIAFSRTVPTLLPLTELLSTSSGQPLRTTQRSYLGVMMPLQSSPLSRRLSLMLTFFYPKPDAQTSIMADASGVAVGAVLQQRLNPTHWVDSLPYGTKGGYPLQCRRIGVWHYLTPSR